ncbi:MAG: ATP-dependent DNA ligase [Thermoleophilia bacterium]|nr:ATP-dependent DNA ligase [Thermoleophilia bacterium]MDH4339893.1 ATP-dependent DNA ligase [Thermoleophilia bacterium]
MLFYELAQASHDVAATGARLPKVARLASCLAQASAAEASIVVAYLSGELPQGAIGVGWAALRELPPPAEAPATLELLDVDAALSRLQAISGRGSHAARREELWRLFGISTELEQRFLSGLLGGKLRQGALEGVMIDAVAEAGGIPAAEVRRAAMLSGDLPTIAMAALTLGPAGLAQFRLAPLQPVKPMLAKTAENVAEALERVGRAGVEWKLDGARIQVHCVGAEVRVFTRNLADVSDRVPEIVEAIAALRAESLVLDGEAIALRADGRPQPFQVTMSRFGTKRVVDDLPPTTPLSAFYFDCLHADGEDLIDRPARERLSVLDDRLSPALVVPRFETDDVVAAQAFLEDALARGHEGVMVKDLDAPYEAGRRGAGWLKVKPAHTLDLVVLAAEWGHGRRHGKLSNLHLGARDPGSRGFVMLGKTFKGMTDEMLAWQTERLLALETRRDGHTVHVRPELVVEIAFDGVQTSPRYPGGVALRFARVKGYREDKSPAEADTIDTVRAIRARAG